MKEASGELSMTVVVIVAAVAIIAVLGMLLPNMGNFIQNKWESMVGAVMVPVVENLK